MQIQINTDHNIKMHEAFASQIRSVVESALIRINNQVRVVIHLRDEDGSKSGHNDKRCVMEARIEGRHPVAVTNYADVLDKAIDGAADKLARLIENAKGKHQDHKGSRNDFMYPKPPEE